MRTALRAMMAASIIVMTVSCTKTIEDDPGAMEQATLDEWVKLHAPNAMPLVDGIYYEILKQAPKDAPAVEIRNWLMTEYDIRDINGNTVYTRSEDVARKEGTYSKYTHYIPDFMFLGSKPSNSTMSEVMFFALLQMKVGEVWRLYSPSKNFYNGRGLANGVGYGGLYSLNANRPVIIDNFRVTEMIEDPDLRERRLIADLVTAPAPEGWGMNEADSLKSHFYMQRLNPDNKSEKVAVGSTVSIFYKAMFMDGTLLDTNIDSVWINRFGGLRVKSDTAKVEINRKSPATVFTEMPKKVFGFILEKDEIRFDDTIRMIVASPYAYGDVGRVGSVDDKRYYGFNTAYYGLGGYAGKFGKDYYDSPNKSFYHFYNTTSTSTLYPVAEVKFFTPVIYEFVVKKYSVK